MGDLISISIPTYRRPSLLLHTLQSCFIQDYRPIEVDVSDNSPTDETRDLIATLTPPPGITLRYWRNEGDVDVEENVNRLFDKARGSRLVLLPDDDTLLPGALSALDEAFARSPDVVMAYGGQLLLRENGEALPEHESVVHNASEFRTPETAGLRRDLLVCALRWQIPGRGFLVDTEAARRIRWRHRSEVGILDWEFNIRLALEYRGKAFVLIDQNTSGYRIGDNRMTQKEFGNHRRYYEVVMGLQGLTPEEEQARDECLARLAWKVMTDDATVGRRRAALKMFFSDTYAHRRNPLRTAYALGLVAVPRATVAARDLLARTQIGTRLHRSAAFDRGM